MDWASLGDVSKEELGSYKIHTRNGAIDDEADSEQQAFEMARRFLSYLPAVLMSCPWLRPAMTTRNEKMKHSCPSSQGSATGLQNARAGVVCDKGSFFEIGEKMGTLDHHWLARLNGIPVAIFAENPRVYGGAWTADAANKLIRLMDLASTFHLPVIHLEDCPGFLIGKQSEEEGTIRAGAAALAAMGQLTTPFCCVVVRKAFGVAGGANHKPGSHHFRAAWRPAIGDRSLSKAGSRSPTKQKSPRPRIQTPT